MERRESFNEIAELYEKARPSYPEELINDIIIKTNLGLEDRLLEIGAGTGKATIQMAKRGYRIHCIEPGDNMAGILKNKCINYPNVTVDVSSFEDWQPQENDKFDLIYSAQAFHWIDPQIRYRKCHSLLREDGHLALFWYQPSDEFSEAALEINLMIKSLIPDFYKNKDFKNTHVATVEMRRSEIVSSGYFNNVEVCEFPCKYVTNEQSFIQTLSSHSNFIVLDNELKLKLNSEIARIFNKYGGVMNSKLVFTLYLARRI